MKKMSILKNVFIVIVVAISVLSLYSIHISNNKFNIYNYSSYDIKFSHDTIFSDVKTYDNGNLVRLNNRDNNASINVKVIHYDIDKISDDKETIALRLANDVVKDLNMKNTYRDNDNYQYLYEDENGFLDVQVKFGDQKIYVVTLSAKQDDFYLYQESYDIVLNSLEIV